MPGPLPRSAEIRRSFLGREWGGRFGIDRIFVLIEYVYIHTQIYIYIYTHIRVYIYYYYLFNAYIYMQSFYRSIWSSWQTSAESWIGSMRKCHAVIGAKIPTSKVGGVFPTGIAVYWAIFVCVCLNFAAAKLSGRSFSNQDASWSKSNPGRIEKEMLSKFSNTLFQDEVCSCFSWILPTCQCAGSFSLF